MEVVKPWQEVEEEEEKEAPLRGRLQRQQSNTTSYTTAIATSKDVDDDTSSNEAGKSSSSDEDYNNGTQRNGVSNGENGVAQSTNGNSGLDGRYDDFLVSKEIPSDQTLELEKKGVKFEEIDVINNQYEIKPETVDLPASSPSPSSFQKENGKYVSLSNGGTSEHEEVTARSRGGEEEVEEEIKEEELDLERLYNGQGRHEFVCPNCRACITKVLVREKASPRPERVRCTSCFSFLTLAGKIFWPDNDDDIVEPLSPVGSPEPLRGPSSQGQAAPSKTPVARQPATTSATIWPDNFETQSHQNTPAAPVIITPLLQKGIKAVVITENKPSSDDFAGLQDPVPSRSATSEFEQKTGTQSIALEASLNNSDSVSVVQEAKTSKDSNGMLHDKKHSVGGLFKAIFSTTTGVEKIENNVTDKVPELLVNVEGPKPNDLKTSLLARSPEIAETVTTEDPVFGRVVPVSTEALSPVQEVFHGEVAITVAENNAGLPEQDSSKSWEILKSIVYGGLAESIASLGIVTSAASGEASTLNIVSLALANLLGGLFIIVHNIWELKDDQSKVHCSRTNKQVDRYEEVLGKRHNFILHTFVAILSFIIFGLVPPVVYGFTFRQTDDKDLKLAVVAVASLVCITLLAVAKAQTQNPHKYFKTVMYYFVIALGVSGVSYLAGEFISQLMEKIESSGSTPALALPPPAMAAAKHLWGSY